MKKTYLLIAASVLFSLPSCSKQDVFQERIDDVNKGLFSILGSKPKDIYRCLGLQYGGSKTISSDDGKQTDFEYKEKRSDGVDVYTYGVKNGLETEFYYRNDAAVGFKTRDPEFGFSYFGYTIGYPIWSHFGEYTSLPSALYQRGYDTDVVSEKREEDTWNGHPKYYAWYSATFQNKLHLEFSWDEMYTLNGSMRTMSVFIDA